MTPNPILKVLSIFKTNRVKCLLIGGQACIIYGAAEFSRDSDFVVLGTPANLELLARALRLLKAELISVPPLQAEYLARGHACHFRCRRREVNGLRVDVIAKLRGCDPFAALWKRRKVVSIKNRGSINVLGLMDLVQSKKTQRDKDWAMLKRLVDNDSIQNRHRPATARVRWWLGESRNADYLLTLAARYPELARAGVRTRPLLALALTKDRNGLHSGLAAEEAVERQKDIEYWTPLKRELEELRHQARKGVAAVSRHCTEVCR